MKFEITEEEILAGKAAIYKYHNIGKLTDEEVKVGLKYLRLFYRMVTTLSPHYFLFAKDIGMLLETFNNISDRRILD